MISEISRLVLNNSKEFKQTKNKNPQNRSSTNKAAQPIHEGVFYFIGIAEANNNSCQNWTKKANFREKIKQKIQIQRPASHKLPIKRVKRLKQAEYCDCDKYTNGFAPALIAMR